MDAIGIRMADLKHKWPELNKMSEAGQLHDVGPRVDRHDSRPRPFFSPLYSKNIGTSNDARFRLPEFDRLFEEERRLPDGAERSALHRKMTDLVIGYAPWLLQSYSYDNVLAQPWVRGYYQHPFLRAQYPLLRRGAPGALTRTSHDHGIDRDRHRVRPPGTAVRARRSRARQAAPTRRAPAARLVAALVFLALAGPAALVGVDLASYARLTYEAPVAEIRFRQEAARRFAAEVLHPDGELESFQLAGDEWQLDARVLKWHGRRDRARARQRLFRLDRIGGRYRDIADERSAPRTVFELARPPGSTCGLSRAASTLGCRGLDALYGSATYLPMADGAHYAVSVSSTGLLARPLNREAREAVVAWH